MKVLASTRIVATAVAALLGLSVEHSPDLELRVADAGVERVEQTDSEVPFYSFLITLENTGTRSIALVGVRRMLLPAAGVDPISDSTMVTTFTVEPGDTLLLGENEMIALRALTGAHYLVLAMRYGDAEDYRTYEGRQVVFKWPGVRAGLVPAELPIARETETAEVLRRAFDLGGWWGDTGPEQSLPPTGTPGEAGPSRARSGAFPKSIAAGSSGRAAFDEGESRSGEPRIGKNEKGSRLTSGCERAPGSPHGRMTVRSVRNRRGSLQTPTTVPGGPSAPPTPTAGDAIPIHCSY
jgi:hypothetical protein